MTKDDAYQQGYDALFRGHRRMVPDNFISFEATEQWHNGYDDAEVDKELMTLHEIRFAGYKAYQRHETRLKLRAEELFTMAKLIQQSKDD